MAKKGANNGLFCPGGSNFDPFYHILQITSKYAQKHHIKKIKKIRSLKKFLSPKNCKNGQKRAKNCLFWPSRAEFCKNQKKAWTFSYFYPREAVYQISENLAHQTWRKCVTDRRTDGQTNGRTRLKS